jgi:hypothetical protein
MVHIRRVRRFPFRGPARPDPRRGWPPPLGGGTLVRVRRHLRRSTYLVGLFAFVALGLAVGSASRVGEPVVTSHSPARAASAADHAAFIGVVEARSTQGLANLIGLLTVALFVGAGWALVASLQASGLSDAVDGVRRWRARLVGAPPRLI